MKLREMREAFCPGERTIWNECCRWIWKKITVILKIVLTCCVLHNGSTAITALFRATFSSSLSMLLIICAIYITYNVSHSNTDKHPD